mgnify:CR=1 FL=1
MADDATRGLTDDNAASPLRPVSSLHAKIQNDIIQTNNLAKNDKIQGKKRQNIWLVTGKKLILQ